MRRTVSTKQALSKRYVRFPFEGIWLKVFGKPEVGGLWICYGIEKNGKTWFALLLTEYLAQFKKVLYISAEEGLSATFTDALRRANIDFNLRSIQWQEYEPIEDVEARLDKYAAPQVVIIDNTTFYADEISKATIKKWMLQYKNTLFVFLAHEERNKPAGALAMHVKKMAKIIINVKGLKCFVSGRCPGGVFEIDEEKAQLYHGVETK